MRLTPANSDLFIGHTTWGDYSKMSRVYKYYRFDLPLSISVARADGFSVSYPGCVSSTDDFYMMDNGLAVMDTTLEVLNPKLYSRVMDDPGRPRLPKFLHVMAVNRVAKTGMQWTSMMAEEKHRHRKLAVDCGRLQQVYSWTTFAAKCAPDSGASSWHDASGGHYHGAHFARLLGFL